MKKTSEAQAKAVQAYREKNPELTYYQTRWRNAKAFVASNAERFEEAKKAVGKERYREDLQALRDAIDEKLNAL